LWIEAVFLIKPISAVPKQMPSGMALVLHSREYAVKPLIITGFAMKSISLGLEAISIDLKS